MWLDIKIDDVRFLLNTDHLTGVEKLDDGICFSLFETEHVIECNPAFYDGFILAVNGLDFISENNFIKPMFHAKNEALYRHIMLKECLNDRAR